MRKKNNKNKKQLYFLLLKIETYYAALTNPKL